MAVLTKKLSSEALYSIPVRGVADFSADGNTYSTSLFFIDEKIGNEMPISGLFARISDTKKFRSLEQPVSFAECMPCYCNSLFLYHYTRLNHPVAVGPREVGRLACYSAKRLRPFARRRLITARPPLVDILFLNPFARTLLILLG